MLAPLSHLAYLQPFRRKPHHLSELIPWFALLPSKDPDHTDGLVLTKDEGLLRTYRVTPLDLSRLSAQERGALMRRLNDGWRLLEGSQWALWHDAVQVPATGYPAQASTAPIVPQLLDRARRQQVEAPGASWQTELYLNIWYRPVRQGTSLLEKILYTEAGEASAEDWTPVRVGYDVAVQQVVDVLGGACARIEPLDDDGILTYLHGLISDTSHPVYTPEIRTHLDYALADSPLVAGVQPKLGERYLGCVSVRTFPHRTRTTMLAGLHALSFGHHLVVRWVPTTTAGATKQLTSREDNFRSLAHSWRGMLYSMFSQHGSTAEGDIHVTKNAHETNELRDQIASQHLSLGDTTITIVLAAADRQTLRAQLREVQRVCHLQGCITVRETVGALSAWLGTLPGNATMNPRHYRVSSYNALHLSTWSMGWEGQTETAALKAPVLEVATTNQCHRFGLSLHVSDVANAFILGPVGSGKTVRICAIVCAWLARFEGAQVFWLDIKRAGRCTALCLGFHYYDIGPNNPVAFQPFRDIDTLSERIWAQEWVIERLKEAGLTPQTTAWEVVEGHVRTAMGHLSKRPKVQRTISALVEVMYQLSRNLQAHHGHTPQAILQADLQLHRRIREALEKFCRGHEYGYLLDADHDDLQDGGGQVFERQQLMDTPALVPAFESYLWHRIHPRLQGQPTLISMDEFGMSIKHPTSLAYVERGLRLYRDKRASFLLATQDPMDVLKPDVGHMLEISCPTRIYMPNAAAADHGPVQAYEALGLSRQAIRDIAVATPKAQAYIQQRPEGEALIDVTLHGIERTVCGHSSTEDHALMDVLVQRYGMEGFAPPWLHYWGHEAEAKEVEQWQMEQRRAQGDPVLLQRLAEVLTGK